jgi:integrase
VPLTIYRRHGPKCPYHGKPRNARNTRACQQQCGIWVEGSLAGEYVRRSLGLTYWEAAVNLVRGWEVAGRIGGAVPPPPNPLPSPGATPSHASAVTVVGLDQATPAAVVRPKAAGPKNETAPAIPEAVDRFMLSLEQQNLAWETFRKYRTLVKGRLVRWCMRERLTVVSDLSVTRMDDFRATWTDGPAYATKNLERLCAFFQFCVDRDWIAKNSAKAIKPPQFTPVPTLPFTEEEMARILAACDRYPDRLGSRARMRAFVLTMRYSGLRISDTVSLHQNQRFQHRLRLYTTKTGQPVYVPLPPLVVETLEGIERPGRRYFWNGTGKLATRCANWSRYLAKVFEVAKIENGHSHRFRDTFSCSLLEQGVSVETVAMLLANSPAIVIKHYAPWIKSRQLALEAAVQTTWQSATDIAEANGGNVATPPGNQVVASVLGDAESTAEADVAMAS